MKIRNNFKRVAALMMVVVITIMYVDVNSLFAYGAEVQHRVIQSGESEDTSGEDATEKAVVEVGTESTDAQEIVRPNGYVDSGYVAPSISDYDTSDSGLNVLKAINIPSSYSAVEAGHVTSVKDQSSWGTCWAFSAIAAMESYALAHNLVESPDDIDFSEYALAYLTFKDTLYMDETGDYSTISSMGYAFDAGADHMTTFKALSKWGGIYNDDGISYSNSVSNYKFNDIFNSQDIEFVLTGQQYINMMDMGCVKEAIIENGAVAVSYYSDSKYYNDGTKYHYNYEKSGVNHGVAIVGWDDNLDKNLFTVTDSDGVSHTPSANGAWLIKNSWGTNTGDGGYFWISYEDISIKNAVVYQVAPKTMYDNIYQHDGATIFGSDVSYEKFAVVYDIKGENKQKIQAVSFAINDVNRRYTVKVYRNSENNILEDGELVATVTGVTTYTGYYTATLPEPVECSVGDSFSIVISFDKTTNLIASFTGYALANGTGHTNSTSKEGQAYYYYNDEFVDFYGYEDSYYSYADLCIKAFTTDVNDEPDVPQISEIEYTDKGQVTITWQKIGGAVSYELWKSTSAEGTDAKVITGITDNTYIDINDFNSTDRVDKVVYGESYYYKVRAVLSSGATEYSLVKSIDVLPPSASNLYASVQNDNLTVKLTWASPDDIYDGYKLYRAKGYSNFELIATLPADTTSYFDDDIKYSVVNNYYIVTYITENGVDVESKHSNYFSASKQLRDVSYLSASNTNYGVVDLSFIRPSAYRDIDGYNIYMKLASGDYSLIASVDKDTTTYEYNMTDFVEGNTYGFMVKVFINEDGNIYESSGRQVSVTMRKKAINQDFRWYVKNTGASIGPSTVTMLKVYNPAHTTYYIRHQSGSSNTYTVSGFVGDWQYLSCTVGEASTIRYRDYYTETYSDPITIGGLYTAPVLQPIEDTCVSSTGTGVVLEAVITNKMENFDYRYQWYVSDTPDGEATAIEGATERSYYAEVEPLAEKYYYCIITCEYGDVMAYTTANGSGKRTKVTGTSWISAPELYDIEHTEDDRVRITWESISSATSYELFRSVNNSDEYVPVASNLTEVSYVDSIEQNKMYSYKVRAVYNDMYSEYSNTKEVYLPLPQLVLERDSDETIAKFLWSAAENIDGYRIYRSDGTNTILLATLDSTETEYTDTTVKSLITYNYYVCTYVDSNDFHKESEKSNVVTVYFEAPTISNFWVDYIFSGSHFMFWSVDNCEMIDGYNIYAGTSSDNLSKVATIDKYSDRFEYSVKDYADGITMDYQIAPYVINNGIEIEGNVRSSSGEVKNSVLMADIRWFVKKNSYNFDVVAVKILEDKCSYYIVLCDDDYTDNEMFMDYYFAYRDEAQVGYELLPRYYSKDTIDYICICDGDETYACQYPPIAVGGPFISPILKPIENVRVNSAEDSVVLEAIITNPMANFDYRYQWYVSDSATGEATAIEGATESTYTVSNTDDEVKYYYCSIICEYIDIITVNTTNVSGGRTMVSGSKSCFTVTLPDDMEGYSISSYDDKAVLSGENFAFTITIATGYTATEDFAVKANGITIEADASGVYTLQNITEDVTITVEGVECIADTLPPTITGIVNGGVYLEDVTFTVSDEYLSSVTVDGVVVELNNSSYTIEVDNKEHTIVAVDISGNKTTINIGMYELYAVTFIADGKVVAKREVIYGQSLAESDIPTVPTKTGYDKTSPYWDITNFSNVTSDIIVNAVYKINTYTVTLNNGQGYSLSKNSAVVEYGDSYGFSISIDAGYMTTSDFAIKANGVVLEADASGVYTVTDIGEDITITVEGVADVTVPIIIGITDGLTYYGDTTFIVKDTCLSTVIVDGVVVELSNGAYVFMADNKEHTVIAIDESGNRTEVKIGIYKIYTVRFMADGILIAQRILNHGQTVSEIPTIPTKTGYDKTAPYWDITDFSSVTSDIVVNAVYTINTYTVTLNNGQGYSFSENSAVVEHGDSYEFSISIDAGYTMTDDFAVKANGVVLEADANGVYTVADIGEDITITIEGVADVTVPTITGVVDGGIYYAEVTFTINDEYLSTVTVDGSVVELTDGAYTIVADNKQHTIIAYDEAGNTTEVTIGVYQVYTVTFVADEKEVAKKNVNYGQSLADSDIPEIPAKTGYDQTTPSWDVTDFSNITSDMEVNAVYTINKYIVTLNSGKGYSFDKASTTVTYGESFSFSVIIDNGYTATASFAVKANDVSLVTDADGVYTISDIAENVTVTVEGVADVTAPVITSVVDGETYYREVTFSVSDDYLTEVAVDGSIVELNNGSYTIVADNKEHTIMAKDESGNQTEITIGVYKVYTVTFLADGVEVAKKCVNYGETLTDIPTVPAKTGYDQTTPSWDVTDFSNITSDMEVNAVYTINKYTVTLSGGRGYSFDKTEVTVTYGESFRFSVTIGTGYSSTENFAVRANGVALVADDDGVYTVTDIATDTTVTVEGVADVTAPVITGVVDGATYYRDVTFSVSDDYLTEVTIDGVIVKLNNSSYTIVADNKEHTIVATDESGNKTEITICVYKVYTVTFLADGVEVAKKCVNYGETLTDIPTVPAKTGYDQTAPYWDVTDFSNITSDVVVNAVYTINKYTVTLNSGAGYSFDKTETTVTYGESFSFSIIIDKGYSATASFAVKANDVSLVTDADGVYTVTDIAADTTVTVEGVADVTAPVITGIVGGATYYRDVTFSVSDDYLTEVTVDGVIVELNNGSYTIIADNKEHTIVATDESGNKIEITIFVYKVYTVTFLADGVEVAKQHVNYGETLTDIPTVPAKTGYDQTAPYWDVTDFSNITSDVVVNAVYTINKYTVTLNSGKGYSFDKTETTVTYGESFSFSVSVAEGYTVTENFAVKANGVSLVADDDGVYKVTDIAADTTVTVEGVADVTAPVITGITGGAVYYTTRGFEIVESNPVVVKINGEVVTDYSLSGDVDMTYIIEVADEAGNTVTVTVTMKSIQSIAEVINNLDESNVKLDDEGTITAVKQTAESVDATYATDAEKAKLNTIISKCDILTEKINDIVVAVNEVSEVINALPEASQTETDSEEAVTALKEAKEAYEALSDYEKSLVSADYVAKLEALEDKLSDYKFIEGAGSTYTKGDTGLVFKVNGAYSKFTTIKVDNVEPGADNYTVEAGSTIVTLNAEYLEALADGEHTLTVVYEDGETTTTFSIEASVMYGDANGDGIIHISDAVILKQALAGMNVSLDEAASDVNCDGVVDIKDAVMVMQYLAGMDVVLGEAN